MNIVFAENDAYLHQDGKPRIFTFKVDGRMFPCPADVTIGQFWERVAGACANGTPEPPKETGALPIAEPTRPAPAPSPSGLQRADTVRYIGKPNEDGDLVTGSEYQVLKAEYVNAQGVSLVDIQSVTAPMQIRLTVLKSDVELVRKGQRVTSVLMAKERLRKCLGCDETIALTKSGEMFIGQCPKCKSSQEEAA